MKNVNFNKLFVHNKIIKKNILYFFIAFILFLIVYLSIGIIKMPANDMKDTIHKGTVLLYRKFLLLPNHYDIVVYNSHYYDESDSTENSIYYFIQRVIGLPGDTILIDSNKVYINSKLEKTEQSFQKNYIIQLTDSLEKFKYIDSSIEEKTIISKKFEYAVSLSQKLYLQLKQDANIIDITHELDNPIIDRNDIFPYEESISWNKHFFGPFYLPKKGDKIILTKNTIKIYYPIIQREEKLSTVHHDTLFINGKKLTEYVFKNSYYFVMGDNRDNAIDSRYIGPIAQKDIVGIVFYKSK